MTPPSASDPSADPALEAALDELFAAPFPEFVDERKRLVVGLRGAGNKAAATALGKVNRPTLASWAINQLVRRSPAEVSEMFASAARVRLGDFAASGEHRQILARLGALATEILKEHAQPTSEATLRRIATSLQALSAYGDFAPDSPGRMIGDRDPPGFDAMALGEGSAGTGLPLALPVLPAAKAAPTSAAQATKDPSAALMAQLAANAKLPKDPLPRAGALRASSAAARGPVQPAADETATSDDGEQAAPRLAPVLRLVPRPVENETNDKAADEEPKAAAPAKPAAASNKAAAERAAAERAAAAEAKAAAERAAAEAAAEAEAAAAAAEAERAVAEAARALAAAQEAAKAAAARVQKARQRSLLDELRTKQRRAASAIFDHEQAIALMERELEQRRAQLATARHDAEALLPEIARLSDELGEPPQS